jgi:hypothetical protein
MHHSIYADSTHTLHRLGKKLLDTVSTSTSALLPDELIYAGSTGLTRCRQLFGEDEESTDELDEAEKQGENGELYLRSLYLSQSSIIPDIDSEIPYFSQPKKLKICGGRRRHSGPFEQRCAPRTRVPMPRKWCFRRYSALLRPYCLVQCGNLTSHSGIPQ